MNKEFTKNFFSCKNIGIDLGGREILRNINIDINKLNNLTRLGFFTPSEDGKLRCSLNGFGSITSRSQPSSSKNPLGAGKWARNFIKPGWGHELFYLDYKAQEPAIAGYLSQDPKLMAAYNTHDIYITTAQQLGMITDPNATKETHRVQRDVVKELFLANTYGMGERELSKRLGCSRIKGREYLIRFRQLYSVYWIYFETVVVSSSRLKWFFNNRFFLTKIICNFCKGSFAPCHLRITFESFS